MSKQIDIFGTETEMKEKSRVNGRRYKKMQELHGIIKGKTCKTCKYLSHGSYGRKRYYKCELWIVSSSQATDIRLKDTACGKYEENK